MADLEVDDDDETLSVGEDVMDEEDWIDKTSAGSDVVAASAPRSPCARRRDESLYGLVPPPDPCISSCISSCTSTTFEGQIIDITYRDHTFPVAPNADPSLMTEDVDDTSVALLVDLHLSDAEGRSMTATVAGFTPPVSYVAVGSMARADRLLDALSRRLELPREDLKKRVLRQSSLVGFDPEGNDALKRRTYEVVRVFLPTASLAAQARRLNTRSIGYEVADVRRDVVIDFLVECNLEACGWVRLENAKVVAPHARTASAQLEITCNVRDVRPSSRRGLAPLLVASYDIETYGSRGAGVFPDANIEGDYICAITTCFWRAGAAVNDRFNVVMVVGHTDIAHGHDTAVECFSTERDLLLAWSELLRRTDPKIVTGYNVYRFDNGFLGTRAHKLEDPRFFWHFGAHLAQPAYDKPFKLESAAYGQNEGRTFVIPGKVVLDVMQYIAMSFKLPLYNLQYVAKHYLNNEKTDLDIPTMFRLVEQKKFDRLIAYVQRDGELVQELLKNRDIIGSVWEMSRATSTLPTDILTRGQQIRVMNVLRRICANRDVAIRPPPDMPKRRFIGARVVDPQRGFYDGKVVTLDFASLYPSIVRAYNLCYSTWINPREIDSVRKRFPDLEIVEHKLQLGQVWEEFRVMPARDAIELSPAGTKKLVDITTKQLAKGYVDVALTDDEFKEAIKTPFASLLKDGPLTQMHFFTLKDASTQKMRRFRPRNVEHYFAKGITATDGKEARCPSLLPDVLEELGTLRKKAKKAMGVAEAEAAQKSDEAAALRAAQDVVGAEAMESAARNASDLAALLDKEQSAYKVIISSSYDIAIEHMRNDNGSLPFHPQVVMNSVYGFCAADTLRLLALAETITYLGRQALGDSIQIAEKVCADMGFPQSKVIYGDTDSIFVHIASANDSEALDVGAKISQECNAHFQRVTKSTVLKLEFEALFNGLLMIGKKTCAQNDLLPNAEWMRRTGVKVLHETLRRYAGLQHAVFEKGTVATRTYNGVEWVIDEHGMSAKPKKYKKGMRSVRRDTPPYVARTQSESIDILLETQSVPSVLAYIEEAAMRLIRNELPRSDFQITMQLKREEDYFKAPDDEIAKQPHLRLVKKLERRSREGGLPQGCTLWGVGERVPYFIAETDDLLSCERAECPVYGEAFQVPPDRVHYFDLVTKALDQGLSVIPEVSALIAELDRVHIKGLRDSSKLRRKIADERARAAKRGFSMTKFVSGASSSLPQPRSAPAPPKRTKQQHGDIMAFCG